MNDYPNPLLVFKVVHDPTPFIIIADPTLAIEGYYKPTIETAFQSMINSRDTYDPFLRHIHAKEFHSILYKGTHYTLEQAQTQFPEFFI